MVALKSVAFVEILTIYVMLSCGFAELDRPRVRRLRVQRAVCSGPLPEVNQVCRWPAAGLECACANGAFCSTATNTCEVCKDSSADCTLPCPYSCRNGGVCDGATGHCQCPPEYLGVDCSTRREGTVPAPPEVSTADPDPIRPAILCGGWECLNGGRCQNGACVCQTGYDLVDCSLCVPSLHPKKCLDHCSLECKHGDCLTVNRKCHCTAAYTGEDCDLCIPAKSSRNCTDICSPMCQNDATCNAKTRKCECTSGWTGEACRQPCPRGTFGLDCLQHCQCPFGPCDPVTGHCLCGPDSSSRPDCTEPCDCLVDGVCYSRAKCPTGEVPESPDRLPATPQAALITTLAKNPLASSDKKTPMMMFVAGAAAGVAVLLIVVIVLIVCLVKSRRENARKSDQTEEAERVPMTGATTGNRYENTIGMLAPPTQQSTTSYRPTSGYEDVTDLHRNVPDLLQKHTDEPSDISPYATTGNVTVHAEGGPSDEYSYVSLNELKKLEEDGKSADGGSYDKLDFLPRERSLRRPVAGDGAYGSLQNDEDTSGSLTDRPLMADYEDASSMPLAGYAKMSPSLNNRKASSLKHVKEDLRSEVQRKAASLKFPSKVDPKATGATQASQTNDNAYVGFNPRKSSTDTDRAERNVDPPPPPPPPSEPSSQQQPMVSTSAGKKPQGEIPQYAKPNKQKSQQAGQQEIPQYAKPNKQKTDVPHYAKPKKGSSSNHPCNGPTDSSDKLEQLHVGSKGSVPSRREPGTGYAHLMHATSPSPSNHTYDYPPNY